MNGDDPRITISLDIFRMNIVVCIKQVPDTSEVKIDPETNTLIREGVESILNPFDAWAIEEAVRIGERIGGRVVGLSMGPPQAEAVLREAVALGADEGVLLSDRAFAGADTLATSYTLAGAIGKIGDVGLILCGKQAVDGDTAQVGPGIAAHLDIPQIIFVRKIREITEQAVVAERTMEDGYEVVSSSLPCLISVVKDINHPRYPTLRRQMAARRAKIAVWGAKDLGMDSAKLGLKGSPTWVDRIFSPPQRSGGLRFEGETAAVVDGFFTAAKKSHLLD